MNNLVICRRVRLFTLQDFVLYRTVDPDPSSLMSSWHHPKDCIGHLRALGCVSDVYDEKHLKLDLWYLSKNFTRPSMRRSDDLYEFKVGDPLFFQLIVQALLDIQIGRPCDCSLWYRDKSPDFQVCRVTEHICADQAYAYLDSLDSCFESMINVSEGYVMDLARDLKKDSTFQWSLFFPQFSNNL